MILSSAGYHVGLIARRKQLLRDLQQQLPSKTWVKALDIRDIPEMQAGLSQVIHEMGGLDLMIISAGIGHLNPSLDLDKELETTATNVDGFTAIANLAFRHFLHQGRGHLVGLSSIAAIRGSADAPAYNASKAYIANYLDGLTQKAVKSGLDITVTHVQPGFVDTAMARGEGLFWVASARVAAEQIYRAVVRRTAHAYVTRRWRLVAWLLRLLPGYLYHRL